MASIGNRLYRGELGLDFVGNAKRFYLVSAVILFICLGSMGIRGFNFGIEFSGGNSFQFAGTEQQVDEVKAAVEARGVEVVSVQVVGGNALLLRTPELDNDAAADVATTVADIVGIDETDVSESAVSARWGGDITQKALQALIVFLIAVVIFIAIRFQPKMAVAAVAALLHDLVMTAGIYSLVGFEVTPSTVIGFLTILGFSLYDTVVVFDKVDENTRGILGGSRTTYSGASNLAVNQTLMRSINTSLIALLPVAGLLFVGAGLLGAGTLKDLALVLFVGLATGAYSSIFLATPILCDLKEREPAYAALRKRVEARRASGRGVDTEAGSPARPMATATKARSTATATKARSTATATKARPMATATKARPTAKPVTAPTAPVTVTKPAAPTAPVTVTKPAATTAMGATAKPTTSVQADLPSTATEAASEPATPSARRVRRPATGSGVPADSAADPAADVADLAGRAGDSEAVADAATGPGAGPAVEGAPADAREPAAPSTGARSSSAAGSRPGGKTPPRGRQGGKRKR